MSPIVARPIALWRIAAIAAVALIATTGLAQGLTPVASAAPADNATFTWLSTTLTVDGGRPGVPDPGDTVTLTYEVAVSPSAPGNLEWLYLDSNDYWTWEGPEALAPGSSRTYTTNVLVTRSMIDALGSGPTLAGGTFTFWLSSGGWGQSFDVPAPPVLYTAPTPITVSTGFVMTEAHGFEPNKLVEGDQVRYVTHVTNTSSANLTLTGTGYATPSGPVTLASGASVDFVGANVGVTYAHMVAGGVAFPDASVRWDVRRLSGTVAAPVGTAPTEAINNSFTSDITTAVQNSANAPVAIGAAVAGDHIDYTFQLTNTGNVVLNWVMLQRDWRPDLQALWGVQSVGTALVQGASLPTAVFSATYTTSNGGTWPQFLLLQEDIDRGYVDLPFTVSAAPSSAVFQASQATSTQTINKRVFLRNFTTTAGLSFTAGALNDTNGDGIGQAGETVSYGVDLANTADQNLVIDGAGAAAGSDVASPIGATWPGASIGPNSGIAQDWTYTITDDDVARGTIDAGVAVEYHGFVDGAATSRTAWADTIPTGVYVAPASTLDTAATYTDTNADGFPSIGESVHVTVTVTNTGSYPLTGLTVTDAAGSDVTGQLPVFAATIAGGASDAQSFDYVLTAADFARGSLGYSTEMTADGLPTTASSTSVNLTDITFQAYSTDLDDVAEGGISVCEADGTPTDTITLLSKIIVTPGESCKYAGLSYGYRVVAYSTPMLLGTNTFTVTVPAALHVGPHRLALYAPNGTLVGWKAVTAKDPIGFAGPDNGANLAATGAEGDEIVGLGGDALLLVLLGTAFIVADSRRRKHSAR